MNVKVVAFGPDLSVPYPKMYTILFNALTTVEGLLDKGAVVKARAVLMEAQGETEALYIEGDAGA